MIDWEKLVRSFDPKTNHNLVLNSAFLNSRFFYDEINTSLFEYKEFGKFLRKCFLKASKLKLSKEINKIKNYLIGNQDNPFKELPIDSEIYYNKLYAVTNQGLWYSTAHRHNLNYPVSSRPVRLWDCPIYSMNVSSNGRLALSAGDEGLFQYDSRTERYYSENKLKEIETDIYQISSKHSLFSSWSYSSIYNSSNKKEASCIALFGWQKEIHDDDREHFYLKYEREINQQEIFQNTSSKKMSWSGDDKIYQVNDLGLSLVRFTQSKIDNNPFSIQEKLYIDKWDSDIIRGKVAIFGTIVEYDDGLRILLSDNTVFEINEPVTKWRIYPRSLNYQNHFHVILDNRIEIYSFNHDFLNDQKEKKFGMIRRKEDFRYRKHL